MATAEPGTLTCEGCDAEMLREVSDALLPHLAQAVVASEVRERTRDHLLERDDTHLS